MSTSVTIPGDAAAPRFAATSGRSRGGRQGGVGGRRGARSRPVALVPVASGAVAGGGSLARAAPAGDMGSAAAVDLPARILVANCSPELATALPPLVRLEIDVLLRE